MLPQDFQTSIDTTSVTGVSPQYPVPTSTPVPRAGSRAVKARYDAANRLDTANHRHWLPAVLEAPDVAGSPQVRQRLRNMSRYEAANNSYLCGIVNTLANDAIGVTPRLGLQSGDDEADRVVETEFAAWVEASQLADKLRTMRKSKAIDGESFAIFGNNPLLCHQIQLDLNLVEADQISTGLTGQLLPQPGHIDGIIFDEHQNPLAYHLLKYHPGQPYGMAQSHYDTVPADDVVHLFRCDRPQQKRGIPEIAPALNLFAKLRRFTDATLSSAEAAAQINLVLETDAPPSIDGVGGAESCEAFDVVPLARDGMMTLPAGYKMSQVDPRHPTSNFENFQTRILLEIARCLSVPRNVALGDSSEYNYSSARADHRTYHKSIEIERDQIRSKVLNPVLRRWLEEARLIDGYLPLAYRDPSAKFSVRWMFDQPASIDPNKDVSANAEALATFQTSYAEVYSAKGQDYEQAFRQIAREKALMKELGLNSSEVNQAISKTPEKTVPPVTPPIDDDDPTAGESLTDGEDENTDPSNV